MTIRTVHTSVHAGAVKGMLSYVVQAICAEIEPVSKFHRLVMLFVRTIALLFSFLVLTKWLAGVAHLPPVSYYRPFIALEIFRNFSVLQLSLLIAALLLMVRFRSECLSWSYFQYSRQLRLFLTLLAGLLGWEFSTYDFNFFFDQGHYFDRILLICLVVAVYWRPVFILPFLLLLFAMTWQFEHPLASPYLRTQYAPLANLLILFLASFLLAVITKSRSMINFLFLCCCLVASYYWWPGFGKLKLNWITHGHLYNMTLAAYAHGWLAFLDSSTIVALARALSWLDWPLRIGTLALEAGALFFLWRHKFSRIFLLGWCVMLTGFFVAFGYCFWKWIVLNIAFLSVFLWRKESRPDAIFTAPHFALSLALIGGAVFWSKPPALAWYDTRLSYTYRFEALGESGRRYDLSARFFAPYTNLFTMNHFAFLADRPQLVNPYGATVDRAVSEALLRSTSKDAVFQLEAQAGNIYFDQDRVMLFDKLVTDFVSNMNARRAHPTWISKLQPPPFLWSFPRGVEFGGEEPIVRVLVFRNTTLYNGTTHSDIRKDLIREIEIVDVALLSPQSNRDHSQQFL